MKSTKVLLSTRFSALLLACACLLLQASPSFAAAIEDIKYSSLPGDRLQIEIISSDEMTDPLSFTINNPARIALDFRDTKSNLKKKIIPIGVGAAKSINVASTGNRTRLVINLNEVLPYSIQNNGKSIYVTLDGASTGASGNINSISSNAAADIKENQVINKVDFRRGDKGEGRIIVDLGNRNMPVNVLQEGNRVIADLIGATIDDSLVQRLDVIDFATPAKYVDVTQNDEGVRISVVPMDPNFEHLAYQSDQTFTLEIKPISKEEQEKIAKDKFGYTGERLSLNFQDIEVRSVLQLIADFTGLNVVVSDSVKGTLTLRLKNVPWDQALDIILKTKGLDKRKSGNVLLVAPTEEIAQQEKVSLEAKQQIKELSPIRSEFIQVNYAKAEEMAELLGGGDKGSIISERGSVSVDERTNTVLISDTATVIENARRIISRLDIPVQQVLVESRIVIANDDFRKQLGARFGITNDSFGTGTVGTGQATAGTLEATTQALNNDEIGGNERLNFNMPVAATGAASPGRFGLALAKLPTGSLIELELSALQSAGDGEIVSTPRVITANQKEAYIEQGVEIPYLEASSGGAATVSFKKAVLSLAVTPQITPDENVILDLTVKQDSVGDVFQNIPSINTREVNTQVLVNNGETIVLGGVFQHETNYTTTKVPFFGDLPLIGRFFRNKSDTENKRELLIFVTPKIVRDTLEFN